jgi:hypothetical protein
MRMRLISQTTIIHDGPRMHKGRFGEKSLPVVPNENELLVIKQLVLIKTLRTRGPENGGRVRFNRIGSYAKIVWENINIP